MKLSLSLLVGLLVCTFTSAISVVYVKHESRTQFVELQRLERERDELALKWTQLQLEYSAWATHDRIRRVASERLQLQPPPAESVVLVTR